MNIAKQPSKEQVRDWMQRRQRAPKPLPDMEQIRRELGWDIAQRALKRVSSRPNNR